MKENLTKNSNVIQEEVQASERVPNMMSQAEKGRRLFFIDHWRAALAILVVLHHTALIYGAIGLYYYVDFPLPNTQEYVAFLMFVFTNQAWFMGAFFLMAGYFVPGSYDRKGARAFLKGRLIRLGIPTLLFFFFLGPITSFGVYTLPVSVTGPLPPAWFWYFYMMEIGPLWFCVMLLFFSIGYAAWRKMISNRPPSSIKKSAAPSYLHMGIFILILALVSYLIRIVVPIGTEVALIPPGYEGWIEFPTIAYLPQYLSFFTIGIVAFRNDWFRTLPASKGIVGFVIALTAEILLFPLAFSGQWFSLEPNYLFLGQGHWQSAVFALWDSIFAVGMVLGLLTLFRRFFNKQGKLGKFLAQNNYAVYVTHLPLVMWISIALSGVLLPKGLKFGLAALIIVPTSFIVAYLIRKIPHFSEFL